VNGECGEGERLEGAVCALEQPLLIFVLLLKVDDQAPCGSSPGTEAALC
jgi:hypothetical protein